MYEASQPQHGAAMDRRSHIPAPSRTRGGPHTRAEAPEVSGHVDAVPGWPVGDGIFEIGR